MTEPTKPVEERIEVDPNSFSQWDSMAIMWAAHARWGQDKHGSGPVVVDRSTAEPRRAESPVVPF